MPKADETLGRGGLVINLLGIACVLMGIGFTLFTATGEDNSLSDVVGEALIFGLIATYGYLTATTSVQVRGDDLVLVRLVAIASLSLSFVSEVDGENGLEVRTKDGRPSPTSATAAR